MNFTTLIATRNTPRTQATTMGGCVGEAADGDYRWEAAVLTAWCGVRVLRVDAQTTVRALGAGAVPVAVTEIVLTVGTTADAQTLALLLDLPAAAADPAIAWRTWTGRVPNLPTPRPVLVTVTAPAPGQEA